VSTLLAINAYYTGDLVTAAPGNSSTLTTRTYIIIPASNEMTRHAELTNVQKWAEQNDLKLNYSKSTEVIFRYNRRRRHHTAAAVEPTPIPGIARSNFLKMLGIYIENNLSIAQHVQRLVAASAQSVYAMRTYYGRTDRMMMLCSTFSEPQSSHA